MGLKRMIDIKSKEVQRVQQQGRVAKPDQLAKLQEELRQLQARYAAAAASAASATLVDPVGRASRSHRGRDAAHTAVALDGVGACTQERFPPFLALRS